MRDDFMPAIRLEIQGMKASIINALGIDGSVLGEELKDKIEKAVIAYDWDTQVKTIVDEELGKTINSYFKYGPGQTALSEAVEASCKAVLEEIKK